MWSWDFVFDRTHDGRPIKLMVVVDEYTRECLAVHVAKRIRGKDAIDVFADLMETGISEAFDQITTRKWWRRSFGIG